MGNRHPASSNAWYTCNMAIETDEKFRRPGTLLLGTGIVLMVARFVIGAIPLIGGALSWMFLVAGIFGIVGGLFLLISKRS